MDLLLNDAYDLMVFFTLVFTVGLIYSHKPDLNSQVPYQFRNQFDYVEVFLGGLNSNRWQKSSPASKNRILFQLKIEKSLSDHFHHDFSSLA